MIHKKDIQRIAKEIFKHDKGIPNPKLMHPARDWQIGIILGLLVFMAVSWWNLNTYITYREDIVIEQTETGGDEIVYREALVTAALESYDEIRETHQSLLNSSDVVEEFPTIVPEDPELEIDSQDALSTSTNEIEVEAGEALPVSTVEDDESSEVDGGEVVEIIGTPILE